MTDNNDDKTADMYTLEERDIIKAALATLRAQLKRQYNSEVNREVKEIRAKYLARVDAIQMRM